MPVQRPRRMGLQVTLRVVVSVVVSVVATPAAGSLTALGAGRRRPCCADAPPRVLAMGLGAQLAAAPVRCARTRGGGGGGGGGGYGGGYGGKGDRKAKDKGKGKLQP